MTGDLRARAGLAALAALACVALLGGGAAVAGPNDPDRTDAAHAPVDGGAPPDGAPPMTVTPGEIVEEEEPDTGPSYVTLTAAQITGDLLEPADKLARFLGLLPGSRYGAGEAIALPDSLERLGYSLDGPPVVEGTVLKVKLKPFLLVRKVRVKGNFPLFNDEILRHLSFTSGTQLPPAELIDTFLREEAARVSEYLKREGYFGNKVTIEMRPRKGEHAVDSIVRVDLGGWARPYTLETIQPQGNRAITDRELLDTFQHGRSIWGRFSLQRMRDDARKAEQQLKDRGYPAARVLPEFDEKRDADAEHRRVTLPIKVSEKRRVDVKFVGNRELGEKELREQLTIFTAGAYDEIELQESARSLVRFYQQHGYYEARVTFRRRRVDAPLNSQDPAQAKMRVEVEEVTFLVEEGPELRVRDVEVVSDEREELSYGSGELLTKAELETKVFPRLGAIGLGSGGYVTAVQLQQDADRLIAFYKSQGFPRAAVRGEVARDPSAFGGLGALGAASAGAGANQTDLYVRFYVKEGPHEVCDDVEIEFVGPHQKTAAQLKKELKLKSGVGFTEDMLADDAGRIVAAYKTLGRPYVAADYAGSSWNDTHTRIRVRFTVSEGPEVRFGEILIRGNFTTRARVIMKDLPFHPGELFDLTKLEQGERNLQTHFIFDSVRLTPVGLASQRNPVPILVTVRERYIDYGGFVFSAGASSDRLPYYVYASLGYLWSNVFGFGSEFEVRGDTGFSKDAWGAVARYSDPRVFGPNWRLDATLFGRSEVTNRLGVIIAYGGSMAITRMLTRSLRLYARGDLTISQTEVNVARLPGSNDSSSVTDSTPIGKGSLGIVWDCRTTSEGTPNPLAPDKGWLLALQVSAASTFDRSNVFMVVTGQALALQPFRIRNAPFTFLANLRFDQGIPLNTPALPAVERFFAGGDITTRGYDNDMLKSEVIRSSVSPLPGSSGFRIVPQGGNIRVLSTVEIQFPIAKTFLGLPFNWVGAVFWDVGSVFDGWNVLGTSDIKHSIGGTFLRVSTPFGRLSLEYAYPLNQGIAEERWKTNPWYSHWPGRIHFNWGIPQARF